MRTIEEFQRDAHEATKGLFGNDAYEIKRKLLVEWVNELAAGDRAHICCWSDIKPCTVIKRTRTTITVRHDKGTLKPDWRPEIIPGGFAGHCINNEDQDNAWDIAEDPEGYTEVFRWHPKTQRFENTSGNRLYPGWKKKYDYNF